MGRLVQPWAGGEPPSPEGFPRRALVALGDRGSAGLARAEGARTPWAPRCVPASVIP